MKTIIKDKYKMAMELVPPGCHHRNAVEVAIRNFKAHFLRVLASAAEDFPPSLWDRLLPQTEITLNMLRQSNATPTVSAYAHLCGPFDYNKMPLTPMGCAVHEVHEKTDKHGTWAYHSVDGWYLSTSPEHYRTHRCHIKATKSERVSDTVNFSHKNITRPTITHADKVMNAITDCAKAIKDITSPNGTEEMWQLVELTEQAIHQHPAIVKLFTTQDSTTPSAPRVHTTFPTITHSVPRVQRTETAQRLTRLIAQSLELTKQQIGRAFLEPTEKPTSAPPTQSTSTSTSQKKRKQRRVVAAHTAPKSNTLAANPRSKTTADAPPATRTRASTKNLGSAAAVTKMNNTVRKYARGLTKKMEQIENEVYQAMAVMDKETGQLLNYKQLLRSAKYKKQWSISLDNKFGRLANGIDNRIKNPTNTIKFIRKKDIPQDRRKDVTYGSFMCSIRPENKKEKNRTRFTVVGDRINYPGAVATPTADMLVAKLLFNSVISTKGA